MIESPMLQPEERAGFTAEIRVENFERSMEFYTEKLGFSIFRLDKERRMAVLKFSGAFFMVMEKPGITDKKGVGFFFRFTVKDIDAYYEQVKGKGAKTLGPPELRSWGAKRFYAEDPDGFRIQFIPEE